MKIKIKNRSHSSLSIPLPEGKSLILGARGTSVISVEDFRSPECQRLFKKRAIFVLPEDLKTKVVGEPPAEEEKPSAADRDPIDV